MNNPERDTIPGELAQAIERRFDEGDKRFAALEAGQTEHSRLIAENTAITVQVKELIEAGRLSAKVARGVGGFIKWAGGIAAGIAALWALYQSIFHQGPPK